MSSHWANAHGDNAIWPRVGSTTPPHAYKPLGLLTWPVPYRQETFCLSTKSRGQVDISP